MTERPDTAPERVRPPIGRGADSAAQSEAAGHSALSGPFASNLEGRSLFWIAVAFSAFQLATAAHLLNIPSQIVRATHVGFLLLLSLPLLAASGPGTRWARLLGWGLGILGFLIGLYQWAFYKDLLFRAGDPNEADLVVGTLGIIVLF